MLYKLDFQNIDLVHMQLKIIGTDNNQDFPTQFDIVSKTINKYFMFIHKHT